MINYFRKGGLGLACTNLYLGVVHCQHQSDILHEHAWKFYGWLLSVKEMFKLQIEHS